MAGAKFIEKKEFLKYSLVFCSVRLNEHSSTEELKCGPALLPLSYFTGAASSPTGPVNRTRARSEDLATFVSPGFARDQTARFRRQEGGVQQAINQSAIRTGENVSTG